MKRQSIQKKRIAADGGGLFVFHSKVSRRKRQRVAASADLASEVPNLGVARALFVILILHVAAIAAIFIHNRVTVEDAVVATGEPQKEEPSARASSVTKSPAAERGETFYFVSTGDTYERIARLKGVDPQELRDLNGGKGLEPGAIVRIPISGTAISGSPPIGNPASSANSQEDSTEVVAKTKLPGSGLQVQEGGRFSSSSSIRKDGDGSFGPERSVPRAIPVPEDNAPFRTYSVKSGDTAWKIARLFKVPVSTLLEANAIEDARKLQVNMKLRIPAP